MKIGDDILYKGDESASALPYSEKKIAFLGRSELG